MRDDDELGMGTQLVERIDETGQVHVVQRGLDLIHHIERAWARGENREQQSQCGQRALATGEQAQLFDALACRAGLNQHARGEQILWILQTQPSCATRE